MTDKAMILPVIIAANEGLKRLGMDSKFCIIVSWLMGLSLNISEAYFSKGNIFTAILEGFLIGSAASGIYDAGKIGIVQTRKLLNI